MTREFFSWLARHQVLAISALNAALIICLAVVIGLGTDRTSSSHLVWALDKSAEAQPARKMERKDSGRQPPREALAPPGPSPLSGKTPAHQEPREEPALKPVELVEPPSTSASPEVPIAVETAAEDLAVEEPDEPAVVVEKAPALRPPAKKQGFPLRSKPQRPEVRTLRARPVPPTQRGRILRPRQEGTSSVRAISPRRGR